MKRTLLTRRKQLLRDEERRVSDYKSVGFTRSLRSSLPNSRVLTPTNNRNNIIRHSGVRVIRSWAKHSPTTTPSSYSRSPVTMNIENTVQPTVVKLPFELLQTPKSPSPAAHKSEIELLVESQESLNCQKSLRKPRVLLLKDFNQSSPEKPQIKTIPQSSTRIQTPLKKPIKRLSLRLRTLLNYTPTTDKLIQQIASIDEIPSKASRPLKKWPRLLDDQEYSSLSFQILKNTSSLAQKRMKQIKTAAHPRNL